MELNQTHKIELFDDLHKILISTTLSTVLSRGKFDLKWYKETFFEIVSIFVFHVLISKIDTSIFKENARFANDIIKSITIVAVLHLFQNGGLNQRFFYLIFITIIGITIYHMLVRPLISTALIKLSTDIAVEGMEDTIETLILLSLDQQEKLMIIPYKIIGLLIYHFVFRGLI